MFTTAQELSFFRAFLQGMASFYETNKDCCNLTYGDAVDMMITEVDLRISAVKAYEEGNDEA